MKDLNNLVVFIKDEAMLEEARRILIENGEKVSVSGFRLPGITEYNYMFKNYIDKRWYLAFKITEDTEITLTELETILKER